MRPITIEKCRVCRKRPRAQSTTGMCNVCLGRWAALVREFDGHLDKWYRQ